MKRLLAIVLSLGMLGILAAPVAAARPATNGLLTDVPVTGTLADGGTFEGLLSITDLGIVEGVLQASGTLTGTATQVIDGAEVVTSITQAFAGIPLNLLDSGGGECQILFLDLGPIFLDLLGLQVDLSQIVLDITAVQGAGNLLGNLLCAVAGLLDGPNPIGNVLNNLLGLINRILG